MEKNFQVLFTSSRSSEENYECSLGAFPKTLKIKRGDEFDFNVPMIGFGLFSLNGREEYNRSKEWDKMTLNLNLSYTTVILKINILNYVNSYSLDTMKLIILNVIRILAFTTNIHTDFGILP